MASSTQFKVKPVRRALGLSQAELAKLLGVKKETVQGWEAGKSAPSRFKVIKLKKMYEAKLDGELAEKPPAPVLSDGEMREHRLTRLPALSEGSGERFDILPNSGL